MNMELLDRYVYAVGRRLPAKQRGDIEKELKSLLLDALDARTGGRLATDDDVAAVLAEFGQPADVAARYTGERYLIGPRLYPVYRMVVGIVLAAMAFGLFLSFLMVFVFGTMTAANAWAYLLKFLGSFVSSVWGAIGVITVVFWGIERGIIKHKGEPDEKEKWDPRTLPPIPKSKHAWKPSQSVVSIVFAIIALVLFNVFPDLVSVYMRDGSGQWLHIPIFSQQALAVYLLLWDISWVLTLILHVVLLVQGHMRVGISIAQIALKLFNIAVLGVMIAGPALFNTAVTSASNEISSLFTQAMPILNMQFKWIFILFIIISVADIVKCIYQVIKEKA
jgi:hypothetical protein